MKKRLIKKKAKQKYPNDKVWWFYLPRHRMLMVTKQIKMKEVRLKILGENCATFEDIFKP